MEIKSLIARVYIINSIVQIYSFNDTVPNMVTMNACSAHNIEVGCSFLYNRPPDAYCRNKVCTSCMEWTVINNLYRGEGAQTKSNRHNYMYMYMN